MTDLNDDARSLFDAARAGYEPKQEDGQRVLRGVLLRAGVATGVTAATSAHAAAAAPLASAAASSGIKGLAFKSALWLAIGASVGVGGYAVSRVSGNGAEVATVSEQVATSSARTPNAAERAPVRFRTPESVSSAQVLDAPPLSDRSRSNTYPLDRAPAEVKPPPRSSSPSHDDNSGLPHAAATDASVSAAFPSAASSQPTLRHGASGSALSVEARALAEVQKALKEGQNAEALRLVEEQRRQFPHGELQPERDAAKIVALCAVGRVADARAAAQIFLSSSPRSPFAARIRASCAGQ